MMIYSDWCLISGGVEFAFSSACTSSSESLLSESLLSESLSELLVSVEFPLVSLGSNKYPYNLKLKCESL